MTNFFEEVILLSDEKPEEEIVGFMLLDGNGSLDLFPVANVTPKDKARNFEVTTKDQLAMYQTGRVFGLYHSHVHEEDTSAFSREDIASADAAELPFLVYSRSSKAFNYYRPKACFQPLEGRQFVVGVQDCVTLVSDFLEQELSFKLPFFARPPTTLVNGIPDLTFRLQASGFASVEGELRRGDVVLMSILNKGAVNHVGVVVEKGIILQQLINRDSALVSYGPALQRATKAVMRLV